jgi:hypothetical protein
MRNSDIDSDRSSERVPEQVFPLDATRIENIEDRLRGAVHARVL